MAKSNVQVSQGLKPDAVLAYVWHRAGVPISEICKKVHKKKTVVHDWIEQIKKLVEEPIAMTELRAAVTGLIPLALKSLIRLIKERDGPTVNNFLNKTIFADIKDSESTSYSYLFNLGFGFERPLTESELRAAEAIRDRIRQLNPEESPAPVGSRLKGPSERPE